MKLEEEYSLYLDCIRFFASVLVVTSHFVEHGILSKSLSYYVPELGREAVIIFFVLSGYVIAYTCDFKKPSLSEYFIARAGRIYSVAFPLLIISFSIVYLFSYFSGIEYYQLSKPYLYIPFHSLFLGEIWNLTERPPWLAPYWSLGYEVWYYIFFASIYFFSGFRRAIIATIVFLILGHKLWLLLPIWMSGVALYKYQEKIALSVFSARLGWLSSLISLALYKYFDLDIFLRSYGNEIWPFDFLILGSADQYLSDYVVTLIVLLNFFCARHARFYLLSNYKEVIRSVSTYTFTLYLVHALVMTAWENLYPHNSSSVLDVFLLIVSISVSTFALGQLTEHRKYLFKNFFIYIYQNTFGKWNLDVKNPYSREKVNKLK